MTYHRSVSDGLTNLLGEKLKVGSGGSIVVVDYMGNDLTPAEAARVSYGGGANRSQFNEHDDLRLVDFLMRNKHTSPFEMCRIRLNIRMPIFVARQWVRHRQASLNEISYRYVSPDRARDFEDQDDFYIPEVHTIAGPPPKGESKQGRSDAEFFGAETVQVKLRDFQKHAHKVYDALLEGRSTYRNDMSKYSSLHDPVAAELARMVLPVGTYTKWTWACDLHNLFHFLRLRVDQHAQGEIRAYAKVVSWIVKRWVPYCWDAWAKTMDIENVNDLYTVPALLENK